MTSFRHFEDFAVGEVIALGSVTVGRDEVIAFAREFDPQPFHLDDEAGRASVLGGLAASGWHTCAMLMRLMCDNLLLASSCNGSPGIDELRWMRPVFPGDTLTAKAEVTSIRPSRSRPDLGIVGLRATIANQDGVVVLAMDNAILFGRREGTA